MIEIKEGRKEQAAEIARLIMMAMTEECCLSFCAEGSTIDDFRHMMTLLVEREDSQYSYRNTLVAMDGERMAGIAVSYDGAQLHALRRAFVDSAKKYLGKDHSGMADETQPGELYVDSLAVLHEYRRRHIATQLLEATTEKARLMGIPCVGLLVDKGNPAGERLYGAVGFRYRNDSRWGGHEMKHLTKEV